MGLPCFFAKWEDYTLAYNLKHSSSTSMMLFPSILKKTTRFSCFKVQKPFTFVPGLGLFGLGLGCYKKLFQAFFIYTNVILSIGFSNTSLSI